MGGVHLHAPGTKDPPEVRGWRIHLVALIVSMAAVAMGYDTSVIGGTMALDSFRRDFGLVDASQSYRDTLPGNIVSVFRAGCFFGSILTFPLADKIGRKRAIFVAAAVFIAGGALMTAAHGFLGILLAGRAVAGLGIGAASLIVPVYIAEISPPSIRGRLIGIFEIASQAGGMMGFWVVHRAASDHLQINYISDRAISSALPVQWNIPLALQLVPGVLLCFGMLVCPESPRWLARNGRFSSATQVLALLRQLPEDHDCVQEELSEMRQHVEERNANRMTMSIMLRRLFHEGVRNRVAIGLLLMACQNLTGVNIITYYSPRIFETLGIKSTSMKLLATGFYGVAKTPGMFIFSLWLVERVGRRRGLIWGAFVGSVPMWYIGAYVMRVDPETTVAGGGSQRNGWGYLAIACIYIYGLVYCATWQGITWVYCSEIFPIDIRMLCTAVTTADQWFWSFVVSRTTPYMITSLGYGTYMFFGALMVAMGFWTIFVPETKGLAFEEMDALFASATCEAVWRKLARREAPRQNSEEPELPLPLAGVVKSDAHSVRIVSASEMGDSRT